MSNPIFSTTLPYKSRCSLPDCQRPVNHVFSMEIEGYMNRFCSSSHARLGEQRWNEKKEKNIRLGVPPKEEQPNMVGDNIDEISE